MNSYNWAKTITAKQLNTQKPSVQSYIFIQTATVQRKLIRLCLFNDKFVICLTNGKSYANPTGMSNNSTCIFITLIFN